jgi:hypothetical protein
VLKSTAKKAAKTNRFQASRRDFFHGIEEAGLADLFEFNSNPLECLIDNYENIRFY